MPWPNEGLRRISVNSFGFGGTNAHVIMDDSYHFLQERGLKGNHCTIPSPLAPDWGNVGNVAFNINGLDGSPSTVNLPNSDQVLCDSDIVLKGTIRQSHSTGDATQAICSAAAPRNRGYAKLLVWSAYDERSLKRVIEKYTPFYHRCLSEQFDKLDRLAFTLAERRSHMQWRTFAIVDTEPVHNATRLVTAKPVRVLVEPCLAFVFTGQGAQYAKMGLDLVYYPIFERTLQRIDSYFSQFGCEWSIFGKTVIFESSKSRFLTLNRRSP